MGSGTALHPQADLARREINIVTNNQNLLAGIELVELDELADALSRSVHIRRRLDQQDRHGDDPRFLHAAEELLVLRPVPFPEFLGEEVHRTEAGIVSRAVM